MGDAPLPTPRAVRMHASRGHTSPRVPFGLSAWSDDADAVVVPLEPSEEVAAVAAQIPPADSLPSRTLVVTLAGVPAQRGLLGRIFTRAASVSRHARATALLARGYVRIAAAVDGAGELDLVWGYTP